MIDFEMLQDLIHAPINNMYTFDVAFTDSENEDFRLIDSDNGFYTWPLFFNQKKIEGKKARILCNMASNFSQDTERTEFSLDSKLTHDEFMSTFFD
ncbi:MAG: hypothetical protein V5786_03740 [Psychromonas sp.]